MPAAHRQRGPHVRYLDAPAVNDGAVRLGVDRYLTTVRLSIRRPGAR